MEDAFKQLVPSFLSPSEFWELSLSELKLVTENVQVKAWQENYNAVMYNRILAADVSKVLAGKQFAPLSSILPPDPRKQEERSIEEIEMTLLGWAYNGKE